MNYNWQRPSIKQIQNWMHSDPLRSTQTFAWVLKQTSEDFTKDLCERIDASRLEPRLAESVLERLLLFANKIDLQIWYQKMKSSPWPGAYVSLTKFALGLKNSKELSLVSKISDAVFLNSPPRFEAFYFDLYNPVSKRSIEAQYKNLKAWERGGFWAASTPYSKEILNHCGLHSAEQLKLPFSKRALQYIINEYLSEQRFQWHSIESIHKSLKLGISKRQLLRYLKQTPKLKKSGELKGTRYRL